MPQNCLFGDTVNTVYRMESNGEGRKGVVLCQTLYSDNVYKNWKKNLEYSDRDFFERVKFLFHQFSEPNYEPWYNSSAS